MADLICSKCGQAVGADGTCVECSAFSAHLNDDAPPIVGAFREGTPPPEDAPAPSILREHHASFLRLLLLFLGAWLLVAAAVAFWAWLGR